MHDAEFQNVVGECFSPLPFPQVCDWWRRYSPGDRSFLCDDP